MAQPQRSRQTVLWALASFVLIQGLLAGVLAWGPYLLRDPGFGYKAALLRHRLTGLNQPTSVVLLGSSRTMWGVNAGDLEQPLSQALGRSVIVFNFGYKGAGPATQLLFLRRLVAQDVRPTLLLVEIHPLLLAGQVPLNDFREDRLPASRLTWLELPFIKRYAGTTRRGLRRDWAESWLVPVYGYRLALLNYLAPQLVPYLDCEPTFGQMDASGVVPSLVTRAPSAEQRQHFIDLARRDYESFWQGFRLGGAHCQALEEILQLCRREKVRCALLVSPEGSTYRSWYPAGVREQIETYVHSLAGRYGASVIDANQWMAEEDFFDSHHLSADGVTHYTERLGREGILPLLSE
jgi:hypothetical protein